MAGDANFQDGCRISAAEKYGQDPLGADKGLVRVPGTS